VAELDDAAKSGMSVRLVFRKSHVVLSDVQYERIERNAVVLAGRIVGARDQSD